MSKVEISASILAADFTRLGDHMREADAVGVDRFHLDVMDGRFVPNISFGPMVVEAARRITKTTLEAHLMIVEPDHYLAAFAKAGADVILVHQEACPHLHGTLQEIRKLGKRAGVVINPATPLSTIEDILPEVEQVLIMSVNPGFGGQKFIDSSLAKVARLRQLVDDAKLSCSIEIDGGVGAANAGTLVNAGVNVLVAGASIFAAPEGVAQAIGRIRAGAGAA